MRGLKRFLGVATVAIIAILIVPLLSYARLTVKTIPQEDQMRQKGIMILCPLANFGEPGSFDFCAAEFEFPENVVFDPHTEHKLHVEDANGNNVDPDSIKCTIIEKDVCHVPFSKTGGRQFDAEVEATNLVDISNRFICKYRKDKEPGLGVLEVYFTGPRSPLFIGDHILKIEAEKDGDKGSEIQDICIIGFPFTGELGAFGVDWPEDGFKIKFADPLFPFASCKNLALFEREVFATSWYNNWHGPFFTPNPNVAVELCDEAQQIIPPIAVAAPAGQ